MKGLMVSLIIVFLAGTTGTVLAAGQQDAAGFEPRSGLQPNAAPAFERPGPDDSDDDDVQPTPASIISRGSTNTSQSSSDQFGSPAPESVLDKDIRFDVKVDQNAIELLRQGRKVFSPVQVRDEATNAALPPAVVSDIALFLDANAGKDLKGVQLDPVPMDIGSKTLRFEIPEQQLDRIEQDAFLFNVPTELRGKFDRVEFVAVSGPTGSHDFSSGSTSGSRGSALGFGNPDVSNRFDTNPNDRFNNGTASENQRWNTNSPQPGPGFEPGEREFTGPYIDPSELQTRRNRVAPLEPNRNFNQQTDFPQRREQARSPLNTGSQFKFADRDQEPTPTRSPFGLPREQPDNSRDAVNQNQINFQQKSADQLAADQRYQQSLTEQRLRMVQQQLAEEKAEREAVEREANLLAKQRNDLSKRLQTVNGRATTQQGKTQSFDYQQSYNTGRDYLGRAIDSAGNLLGNFGTRREDFQTRETGFVAQTQTEKDQRDFIEEQQRQIDFQRNEKIEAQAALVAIENRLASAQGTFGRRTTYGGEIQQTSYNSNAPGNDQFQVDRRNPDGSLKLPNANTTDGRRDRVTNNIDQVTFKTANGDQNQRGDRANGPPPNGRPPEQGQEQSTAKGSSSDLIWLLPLLLASLGLNFFLWVHCRSLDLRYADLADELRGMVGASTI